MEASENFYYVTIDQILDAVVKVYDGTFMDDDRTEELHGALLTIFEACREAERLKLTKYYYCADFYPQAKKVGPFSSTILYPIASND